MVDFMMRVVILAAAVLIVAVPLLVLRSRLFIRQNKEQYRN